jgi:tmRNA-binding protein
VKSLRQGRCSLVDAYAVVQDGEAYLMGAHIPEYTEGTWNNHTPRRTRKLLLHRKEIDSLVGPHPRERPGARAAVAVLQGRPREGRDRARSRAQGP